MKSIKISVALSVIMIFAAFSAKSSIPVEDRDLRSDIETDIIYNVQINNNANGLNLSSGGYLVVMTDVSGRLVAAPQLLKAGVWSYTFSEKGSVHGTRVARLIALSEREGSSSRLSTSKTGVFLAGATYLFVITPNRYVLPVIKN